MSHEYIASLVILLGAILKAFGIEVANDSIQGIIAGVLALWIAIRRYNKGDIELSGLKK